MKGSTLIELLVVIAIIVILSSMPPMPGNAREKAKAKCIISMKQQRC